ncbi:MAG: class I SAM-dependent methyltransferase [Bacteroidota bacterium]
MHENEKQKWNLRYKDAEFAFGKEPNVFFREWILKLKPGRILLPADGEGRNGVFAAELGWAVTSFDLSNEGKIKTLQLAKERNVSIEYIVGDFSDLDFEPAAFDAVALIYAHFPANKKSEFHTKLKPYLKPGGIMIFEAFSKKHLAYRVSNPGVGGPTDIDVLYDENEIITDFSDFEILALCEETISLDEGKYHVGQGSVIRFIGRKN